MKESHSTLAYNNREGSQVEMKVAIPNLVLVFPNLVFPNNPHSPQLQSSVLRLL